MAWILYRLRPKFQEGGISRYPALVVVGPYPEKGSRDSKFRNREPRNCRFALSLKRFACTGRPDNNPTLPDFLSDWKVPLPNEASSFVVSGRLACSLHYSSGSGRSVLPLFVEYFTPPSFRFHRPMPQRPSERASVSTRHV